MHGVRLVSTPPAKTIGIASAGFAVKVSRSEEKSTWIGRDLGHASLVLERVVVNTAGNRRVCQWKP
jgi:hypothetical protein